VIKIRTEFFRIPWHSLKDNSHRPLLATFDTELQKPKINRIFVKFWTDSTTNPASDTMMSSIKINNIKHYNHCLHAWCSALAAYLSADTVSYHGNGLPLCPSYFCDLCCPVLVLAVRRVLCSAVRSQLLVPWAMFPLIFKSLCPHKISCVQHFTSTRLYLEQHVLICAKNIF